MNASTLFARNNCGVVITFGVHFAGCLKNPLRAELNAQLTAFATVWDKIDLAAWNGYFLDVERLTIEYSHQQSFRSNYLFLCDFIIQLIPGVGNICEKYRNKVISCLCRGFCGDIIMHYGEKLE
jgi:hypothetical protein